MLEKINDPKDLKKLDIKDLSILAGEIRSEIVKVVSVTGGHLSSNLGAVDLTLALHYVFDAPRDKIVWDVGHQTYAHKLITGRRGRFHTLRKHKGLSGFPKREESVYDVFDSGHSSTSISVALGIACARDLQGEDYKVVAVIGDGSMTSGVAFEGLNQAGGLKKNIIVILNDNEMSISKNVGALSKYLTKLITNPDYNKLYQNLKDLLQDIPVIGDRIVDLGKKMTEGLKGVFVPGALFEEMGFRYFGPVDGHNIPEMADVMKKVSNLEGPRLIHVVTKKGRGFKPAEDNPDVFHSSPPFDLETGILKTQPAAPPSFARVFARTLIELAERDEKIVAITAAMSLGTGLEDFSKKYPQRFFDVGIAEEHAMVFAAGLALEGMKPVVAIYSTFLQRAYDQVLHDICLQNLSVVIISAHSGIVGEDGPTHHGVFDLSYLRHLPGITVMAPKDEAELRHMLKTACNHKGPVAIRYPKDRGVGADISVPLKMIDIGLAEVLKKGGDIAVLGIGSMVYPCLKASEILEKEGIKPCVVNARFIKPLDRDLLVELAGTFGKFVTVEENTLEGGFGSAVMELFEKENLAGKIAIKRIGLPDRFIEHGPRPVLLKECGLDAESIAATIEVWFKRQLKIKN